MEEIKERCRILHIAMSVSGGIRNAKDLKGCITVNGRELDTVAEIRACLNEYLKNGKEVLPMCDCLGFDFKKGCPGHTQEDNDRHKAIMRIARAICAEEKSCERWCGTTDDCAAYRDATKIYEERSGQ